MLKLVTLSEDAGVVKLMSVCDDLHIAVGSFVRQPNCGYRWT